MNKRGRTTSNADASSEVCRKCLSGKLGHTGQLTTADKNATVPWRNSTVGSEQSERGPFLVQRGRTPTVAEFVRDEMS